MEEDPSKYVEKTLLHYTGTTRVSSICLGIFLDQHLITKDEHDSLCKTEPTAVSERLYGVLKKKENGVQDFVKLLQKYEFVLHWITPAAEADTQDPLDLILKPWDFIAKRMIQRIDELKMGGMLDDRFKCRHATANREFAVEVYIIDKNTQERFVGYRVRIFDGAMRGKKFDSHVEDDWNHHLTEPCDNTTLIVNTDHIEINEDILSPRVVFLMGPTSSINPIHNAIQDKTRISEWKDDPLQYAELTQDVKLRLCKWIRITVAGMTMDAVDLYNNLDGLQLNRMLQKVSLKKPIDEIDNPLNMECASRQQNFSSGLDMSHVHRWLNVGELSMDFAAKDGRYIVCNGTRSDLPQISSLLKTPAYYTEDLFCSHQSDFHQVLVTKDVDYYAAQELLTRPPSTSDKMILHYENCKLFRVISSQDLYLKADEKRLIITGPPGEGKSTLLKSLRDHKSVAFFIFPASKLIKSLDENISRDDIIAMFCRILARTKFERAVLKRVFENHETIVGIEDDLISKMESFLPSIIEVFQVFICIPKMKIIVIPRCQSQLDAMNLTGYSAVVAKLLPLSTRDIINILLKEWNMTHESIAPRLVSYSVEIICNKYYFPFRAMPPLIWKAVAQSYKEIIFRHFSCTSAKTIPLKITVAQIYDQFFRLRRECISKKYWRNYNDVGKIQRAHVYNAIQNIFPDTPAVVKSSLSPDTMSIEVKPIVVDDRKFNEYLVDVFSLQVLLGDINNDEPDFFHQFEDFFIERYVKAAAPSTFHLNDMLGYTKLTNRFPFTFSKYKISELLLLSRTCPNIIRILFEAFLDGPIAHQFVALCKSGEMMDINVSDLFRFMNFKRQKFPISKILLLCSVYFGFYKLFNVLVTTNSELALWQSIPIRDRSSFKTLLHLLMYLSRDNDNTTICEKTSIMDHLETIDPEMRHRRDYYGNIPILERNIHFKLLEHLLKGSEDHINFTDYNRRNLLDKNTDNPELLNWLKSSFATDYNKLLMSALVRSHSPNPSRLTERLVKKMKYDEHESDFRKEDNPAPGQTTKMEVEVHIDGEEVEKLLNDRNRDSDVRIPYEQIALYVRKTVCSGTITNEFVSLLLWKILETEDMSFKNPYLCNIVDIFVANNIPSSFMLSPEQQERMYKINSPFIVAIMSGYQNIAMLFGTSFMPEWLKKLENSELANFLVLLERNMPEEFVKHVSSVLEAGGYGIPWAAVKITVGLGSLAWFSLHKTQSQITEHMQKEALTCLLENSTFEDLDVVERKKELIERILPKSDILRLDMCESQSIGRVHYRLIRYLIEKKALAVNTTDSEGRNILNYCLENIKSYSDYLDENVYDKDFTHHDQIVYLAKTSNVTVNDLANIQINSILRGIQRWVKVKTTALQAAGFKIDENNESVSSQAKPIKLSASVSLQASTTPSDAKILYCGGFPPLKISNVEIFTRLTDIAHFTYKNP